MTIGGDISGSGGVTQTGPGVLTLTGNNTYQGPTVISGGTLQSVPLLANLPAPVMNLPLTGPAGAITSYPTTLSDVSGNNLNLTLVNNWGNQSVYVPGKFAGTNALQLVGGQMALIGGYNQVTGSSQTNPLPVLNTWTTSVWINIPASTLTSGASAPILSTCWNGGGNANGLGLWYNPNEMGTGQGGFGSLVLNDAANAWIVNKGISVALQPDTWYMVTRDGDGRPRRFVRQRQPRGRPGDQCQFDAVVL